MSEELVILEEGGVPPRCYYCQDAEHPECPGCHAHSRFRPTEESVKFKGLNA
ncbi:MAG: hypothetical protein LLG45_13275 [Actinomycetia bacterium]|nr:hypothetical protein [Actinomycetes bacterium]